MDEAAKIKEGFTIFAASPSDDAHVQAAKDFIKKNELTGDDVKLGRAGNTVLVITKREIKLLF